MTMFSGWITTTKCGWDWGAPLFVASFRVDYAIMMAGEIDMMLDTGTVRLRAGTTVTDLPEI